MTGTALAFIRPLRPDGAKSLALADMSPLGKLPADDKHRKILMRIVSDLLAQALRPERTSDQVLEIGGEGDLPLDVAELHPDANIVWIATDVREESRLAGTISIDVRSDPARPLSEGERFDAVLLPVPPDRRLTRRWLVLAAEVLADGGMLAMAGANTEGIKSAIADAKALFGPARSENYAQKHRVARFAGGVPPDSQPEWTTQPGIAPGTWEEVAVNIGQGMLSLATLPGVFAGNRLDVGTSLLLDHLHVVAGSRVLDVGCGAGAIGLSALRLGASQVDMIDVNLLAVAAVRETVARQAIANAHVFASDVYDALPGERYDLIVSNPPFHQGKTIDYTMPERLLREAPAHLHPDGSVLIVANAFLTYGRELERIFRNVEVVAATRQYHVLKAASPR